ncbi:MAG: 8-amino-7-oxononanoate synthase [Sorangiineae bacterium]|nr:8-amino-7-oxononanoate synthase [Polyangiaceae bacterium]MEB2322911.1 8-amino-7-oxononanoate synthase [Sorangiineae bacterium]
MALDFLDEGLAELERTGLLRVEAPVELASELIDVCSNDYLGYGRRTVSRETLPEATSGAGASRLIHGSRAEHHALEGELASWVGLPRALLFSSGYAANVGVITALVRPGDLVASDALNHASIVDGSRLSRADLAIYPHLDLAAAEQALSRPRPSGRRWLVTESYFSMDGDAPDLPALADLCRRTGAGFIVDEAHALGVHGPSGSGLCAATGVVPDALIGTLGKAVGAQGAFVAGAANLRAWLWNRARSLVFSTAGSPLLAALTLANVREVRRDDAARAHLRALHDRFVETLAPADVEVPPHLPGPIVPILLGSNERAVRVAERVRAQGFLVQPIRPPTVPPGTARLRLTLHATMPAEQVTALARAIALACAAS